MKRLLSYFFVIVLSLTSIMGWAQGCLEPSLSEAIDRIADDEKIEVVMLMKSQYDRSQLCRRASFIQTKSERRTFMVNELKACTEASQYNIKEVLSEMEQQGMVSSVHSLWSANALYFSATKAALLELSKRTDIEIISRNVQHQLIPKEETSGAVSDAREITPNISQVNADQVWALGYTGAGVVVAVVDSGVNYLWHWSAYRNPHPRR